MRVDKLQFQVWKTPLKPFVVPFKDNWPLELKPKHYSYSIDIEIFALEFENGEEVTCGKIGFIESAFIDVVKTDLAGDSVYNVFDAISADMLSAYKALTINDDFNNKFVGRNQNILLLDSVYIEEEYRKQGIAKNVIINLEKLLCHSLGLKVGCIITIPEDFGFTKEDDPTIINTVNGHRINTRFQTYMRKLGYKEIANTDFMYLNPDYKDRGFKVV